MLFWWLTIGFAVVWIIAVAIEVIWFWGASDEPETSSEPGGIGARPEQAPFPEEADAGGETSAVRMTKVGG